MNRQNNKRPLTAALMCLALFAGACSGGASEEPSAQADTNPPEALAHADAIDETSTNTAGTEPSEVGQIDDAPEPVAMVEVLKDSGIDDELAACYSDILAQNGITEVADFDELADALTEVTIEQASEMDMCLAASQG